LEAGEPPPPISIAANGPVPQVVFQVLASQGKLYWLFVTAFANQLIDQGALRVLSLIQANPAGLILLLNAGIHGPKPMLSRAIARAVICVRMDVEK
jgi:hypothetical protein